MNLSTLVGFFCPIVWFLVERLSKAHFVATEEYLFDTTVDVLGWNAS